MHLFSSPLISLLLMVVSHATACGHYDFCRCYDTRVNLNNEDVTRLACEAQGGVMVWGDPDFGMRCRKSDISGDSDSPGSVGFWNCAWREECNAQAGTNTTEFGGKDSHVFVDHCVQVYYEGENGKSEP